MNKILCIFFLLTSCYRVPDTIEPNISSIEEEKYIETLSCPFTPLSDKEKNSSWGKEYAIALAFAKEFDLYRAISTFKRAKVLVPKEDQRALEIDYLMLYCYFLAKRYEEVINIFATSHLLHVDSAFVAYEDLLIILHKSYLSLEDEEKAEHMLHLLSEKSPHLFSKLILSEGLAQGDLSFLTHYQHYVPPKPYIEDEYVNLVDGSSYTFEKISLPTLGSEIDSPVESERIDQMLQDYKKSKKSVRGAQALNALCPGAGYLYVGLKKSALTSVMLNGLFAYATYHFFSTGNIAAGSICLSFEMGWYFGGIYGAGEQAKFYNERLYEKLASKVMNQEKLFPAFMLQFGF